MKRLRRILFWFHLPIGLTGGVVILIMCVTGILLSYEKQITSWANTRNYNAAPPSAEAKRIPLQTLLQNARDAKKAAPSAITLRSDATAPAEVSFGREGSLFLNSYSGQVLGEGSPGVRNFFRPNRLASMVRCLRREPEHGSRDYRRM